MSYMTFKIISLVLMVIILIITLANRNNKEKKKETNSSESIDAKFDETNDMSENGTQVEHADEVDNKIDYKAVHDEMYYVEYKLIPHIVELYNEQPERAAQIIITIYENLVTLQNHLRRINPYAFGKIDCDVCGDIKNECLVVYTFPEAFDIPLAKYGAIYFNQEKRQQQYWTLEMSLNGFVLGSKTSGGHANYGHRDNMTKEEFIREVCQVMGIDEGLLHSRNKICRQHVMEMNDRSFQDVTTHYSPAVVCFYDFNKPCETFIPILEQVAQEFNDKIAIGIYDVYGGDENTETISEYNIMALPTLLFFKNGKEVKRHIGICDSTDLKTMFEEQLYE